MNISYMSADTVSQVLELERLCFSNPWSKSSLDAEMHNPVATWLVAEIDGQVAGYAGMHIILDEAYITNVAVSPNHRKKGVAKALLLELENICRQKGSEFITLEVRKSNTAAIYFYNKLGFEKVGCRKNYYTHPAEDALLLTKLFYGETSV